jgi:hypothetical protein
MKSVIIYYSVKEMGLLSILLPLSTCFKRLHVVGLRHRETNSYGTIHICIHTSTEVRTKFMVQILGEISATVRLLWFSLVPPREWHYSYLEKTMTTSSQIF